MSKYSQHTKEEFAIIFRELVLGEVANILLQSKTKPTKRQLEILKGDLYMTLTDLSDIIYQTDSTFCFEFMLEEEE